MEGIIKQKVLKIFSVLILVFIVLMISLVPSISESKGYGGSWGGNHEPSEDDIRQHYITRCERMRTPPDGLLADLLDIKPWELMYESVPTDEAGTVYPVMAVLGTVMYNGEIYTEHPVELTARGNTPTATNLQICVYGGADIDKGSTAGKQQPDSAHFTIEPLIRGTFTVRGIVDLDGADITWSDFYNWATDALTGKDYLKGAASFEVREVETTVHGHPSKTLEVYQSGKKVSNTDKGVVLRLEKVTEGGIIEGAIKTAVGGMLSAVGYMISASINLINELLYWTEKTSTRENVQAVWLNMRNLGISLLVLVLVIIAFANTLQIRVEQYGVNRMIPKIIIAIILAYFSWIIVMFFFDFANAIQGEAESIVSSSSKWDSMVPRGDSGVVDSVVGIGNVIFLFVIFVVILIALVALLFSLLVRAVILSFLIAVAPFAMILSILPFTEKYYKRWWGEFFKWLFMGPLAVFVLALGAVLAGSVPVIDGASIEGDNGSLFLSLFMLLGAIVFAASLPLTLGGKIMGQWQNLGKKAANWSASRSAERAGELGKKAPGRAGKALGGLRYLSPDVLRTTSAMRKGARQSYLQGEAANLQDTLAQKGALGRAAAGVKKGQVGSVHQNAINAYLKNNDLSALDPVKEREMLSDAIDSGNTFMRDVYMTDLATKGKLFSGSDPDKAKDHRIKKNVQSAFDDVAQSNMNIRNNVAKNEPEVLLSSSVDSIKKQGLAMTSKTPVTNWSTGTMDALATVASGTGEDAAAAKQMLSRVNGDDMKRLKQRGSQAQIEKLSDTKILSHFSTGQIRALKNVYEEAGYDTSLNGGPSEAYQRVVEAEETIQAGRTVGTSQVTPEQAQDVERMVSQMPAHEQEKIRTSSEARERLFNKGAHEIERAQTVEAGRTTNPEENYTPTTQENTAAEAAMSDEQLSMTRERSRAFNEGVAQTQGQVEDEEAKYQEELARAQREHAERTAQENAQRTSRAETAQKPIPQTRVDGVAGSRQRGAADLGNPDTFDIARARMEQDQDGENQNN